MAVLVKPISLLLVALLVGAPPTIEAVIQYSHSQQIADENLHLRQQLEQISGNLTRTNQELDQARQDNDRLKEQIAALEENVTQLRQQLEDKALQNDAITIGLSFLSASPMEQTGMERFMHRLNEAWDRFNIYFFVYRNEVWPSLSLVDYHALHVDQACPTAIWNLYASAQKLYPGNDIPIFIVPSFGVYDGFCCWWTHSDSQILIAAMNVETLSHELLHSFGLHTEEAVETILVNCTSYDCVLQPSLASIQSLQAAARQYQMPIPPDDASPSFPSSSDS